MLGHVVAMGGGGFLGDDPSSPLDDLLVSLAPRRRPRAVFLPTAAGDSERAIDALVSAAGVEPLETRFLG